MLIQCLPYYLISHKPVLRGAGLLAVGHAELADGPRRRLRTIRHLRLLGSPRPTDAIRSALHVVPRRLAEGFGVFMRSLLSDELPLFHQISVKTRRC
jgi:hypothetical protein